MLALFTRRVRTPRLIPPTVPAGPSPLIDTDRVNFLAPVPLGRDDHDRPVSLPRRHRGLLIGGTYRSGSSHVAWSVALAAALDPTVHLHVHELLGCADWTAFHQVAKRLSSAETDNIRGALDDMRELGTEVDRRARTLRSTGRRRADIARDPENGMPPILLVLDGMQEATGHPELGEDVTDVLTHLLKVGPAVGLEVLATFCTSRRPAPLGIRHLFPSRLALRVALRTESDLVFGAGHHTGGIDLVKLPAGVGVLRTEQSTSTVRAYRVLPINVETICRRGQALRAAA